MLEVSNYLYGYNMNSLSLFTMTFLICRFAPKPDCDKGDPADYSNPDPRDPNPARADHPTPRPLIMCEMPDSHFSFHVDVGKEWPLVVDTERKDAMLVWQAERSAVDSAVPSFGNGLQIESMEGRKHGEFQLDGIS